MLPEQPGARRCRRGRKSGRRRQERRNSQFRMFFGNVTSMSPKAEAHLLQVETQAFMAVESHLMGARLQGMLARAGQHGWLPRYSLPQPSTTSETGCYGGAVAGLRKHVHGGPLCDDEADGSAWRSVHKQLVGMQVALQGADTLWFGSYHRGGLDHEVLAELSSLTQQGARPFVALADWNDPPQVLAETGWLELVNACIIVPNNSDHTCVSPNSTSLLDYAVVSCCLRPLVRSLEAVAVVPWKPHYGLLLSMRRNACDWKITTLWRPKQLPRRAQGVDASEDKSDEGDVAQWKSFKDSAEALLSERMLATGGVMNHAKDLVCQLGTSEQAHVAGLRLWRWTRALEMRTVTQAGLDIDSTEARKSMGRAGPPVFVQVSMVRCRRGPHQGDHFVPMGYGVAARTASCLAAMGSRLTKAATTLDYANWSVGFLQELMRDTDTMRRTWVALGDGASVGFQRRALSVFSAISLAADQVGEVDLMRSSALARHADAIERKLVRQGRVSSLGGFKSWIEGSLKSGGRLDQRWCNAPNLPGVGVFRAGSGSASPQSITDEAAGLWATKWQAGVREDWLRVVQALSDFRLEARAGQVSSWNLLLQRFAPARIRKCCKAFKARTAIGADGVSFELLAEQPDHVLKDLGDILVSIVKDVALPVQELLSIMALLAKKAGGWRTIAICPTFYRLLMALLADDFESWDESMDLDGVATDSAAPGHSAERVAARRQLLAEVAAARGLCVVQLLWDIEAFYDSIDISKLLADLSNWDFPQVPAALALQLHVAPRALQAHGCFAPVISQMGRSILAGCLSSTRFARAVTREPLLSSMDDAVKAAGVHVDDVTQVFAGRRSSDVKVHALRAGSAFGKAMQDNGFTISLKSVVVSSDAAVAKQLAAAFRRTGLPMKAAAFTEDLGVPAAGGNRRVVCSSKKRLHKGLRRAARVRVLTKFCPRAKVLYLTGVRPQQQYGIGVMGAAPSQRSMARRAAAVCLGNAGWRPCLASLLKLKGSDRHDPEVELMVQQIALWLDLWWRASSQERHDITEAWRIKRDVLGARPAVGRWRIVAGPMSATIATLLELGWYPIQPNHWLTPDKTQAAIRVTIHCQASILEAIRRSAERRVWKIASEHWGGQGLEQGVPDFSAILKLRRHLVKNGKSAEVAALHAIACGGAAIGERRGHDDRACPYCGAPAEDAAHRYYLCPTLSQLEDPDGILAKTSWTVDKVRSGAWSHLQCLWTRGILPRSVLGDTGPADDHLQLQRWSLGPVGEAAAASGAVFSDGSGGERYVPQQIRRAGAGGAAVDFNYDGTSFRAHKVGLVLGEVPGRQTVPRAELTGAELILNEAAPGRPALWSDASYVVSGAAASGPRLEALLTGANGDLWGALFDVFDPEEHPAVGKVKGHRSISAVLEGRLSIEAYVGNHLADAAADAAAQLLQPSGAHCMHVELWIGIAYRVAQRLCFIEAARWRDISRLVPAPELPRVHRPLTVEEIRHQISSRIAGMGHSVQEQGSGLRCIYCLEWRHRKRCDFFESVPCAWARTSSGNNCGGSSGSAVACPGHDLDNPDGEIWEEDMDEDYFEGAWHEADNGQVDGASSEPPRISRTERRRRLVEHRQTMRESAAMERRNEAMARALVGKHAVIDDARQQAGEIEAAPRRHAQIHASHEVRWCGGITFCLKCGGTHTGSGVLRGLLPKGCKHKVASGSVDRLSKLKRGILPAGFAEWPDAASAAADRRCVRRVLSGS